MPNRMPPRTGYERSNHQLGRSMLKNPLRDFLRDLAKRDRVEAFFDFMDWGETSNFTMAQTQTGTTFTVIDGPNGVMAGTNAATATASLSAIGKTQVLGNANPEVEVRWKISTTPATYAIEIGFVNAAPATGASVVADIDTGTFFTTATNAAIFGVWSNQTHAGFGFASIGSFTGQTMATTLLTSGTTAPTADTYATVTVGVITDPDQTGKSKCYAKLNGKTVATHDSDADGHINGQAAIYPWIYIATPTGTVARVFTVDYVAIRHDRAALEAALE